MTGNCFTFRQARGSGKIHAAFAVRPSASGNASEAQPPAFYRPVFFNGHARVFRAGGFEYAFGVHGIGQIPLIETDKGQA